MTEKDRKEMAQEIEKSLNELNFDLEYNISDYHDVDTSIVDLDIDIYNSGDRPENWNNIVDDIISNIAFNWGGFSSWEGWCISVSVYDSK